MKMKFILFAFLLIIFSLMFAPKNVFSHGSGVSLEQEIGEYAVDIGYEPIDLVAGETTIYDFELLDKDSREPIPYTDMWVRVDQGAKTIFASGINKQSLGATTMLFTYPEAGDYEFFVRYQNEEESILETSFPLVVVQEEESASFLEGIPRVVIILLAFISAAAAFVLGFSISKTKKIDKES